MRSGLRHIASKRPWPVNKKPLGNLPLIKPTLHCPCSGQHLKATFHYTEAPVAETAFKIDSGKYERAYSRCDLCGHWFSDNPMDIGGLYDGVYLDNTYGERMRATYDRILALPTEKSDNVARAACIIDFARRYLPQGTVPRLLDVGAGLSVFAQRMKAAGWLCTALDPDERAVLHARDVVGIDAIAGDFMKLDTVYLGSYDVITFNKVLEHVEDPVAMLARALPLLATGGFIYFEVPDGEAAASEGPEREEFFIEHHHVFSAASAAIVAVRAGLRPLLTQCLREPSNKFTIRVFADRATVQGTSQAELPSGQASGAHTDGQDGYSSACAPARHK
jgi:SAM-dependent methyltransferase